MVACITTRQRSNESFSWSLRNQADGWTDELQSAFVADFGKVIQDITGSRFSITQVREDDPRRMVEALGKIADGQGDAGPTVIVFDDRLANGASYYLLSHGFEGMASQAAHAGASGPKMGRSPVRSHCAEDRKKAERRWLDMVTLSVLDTLDQMEAIPWRIADWPYEACMAIDVGEGRRHFAMSLAHLPGG